MFDRIEIMVKGGGGGDGAISFRREKFVPFGGPDGGEGGNGGSVVIRADESVDDLRKFKKGRIYRAVDGKRGGGSGKHGRNGEDLVLTVPLGTVVSSSTETGGDAYIADLEQAGDEVVVARGGKGGLGKYPFCIVN